MSPRTAASSIVALLLAASCDDGCQEKERRSCALSSSCDGAETSAGAVEGAEGADGGVNESEPTIAARPAP